VRSEIFMTSLSVFDITGKVVHSASVPNVQTFNLSLTALEKGIYLINGTDGTRSFTRKVVKN